MVTLLLSRHLLHPSSRNINVWEQILASADDNDLHVYVYERSFILRLAPHHNLIHAILKIN